MSGESLSDRMLRENAEVFARMVNHRFVQDIAANRLPAEVFDRYLVIEGSFVDTAIAIFASPPRRPTGSARSGGSSRFSMRWPTNRSPISNA